MYRPRVGISDVYPKKDLYQDPYDAIITSRMAVSNLVDNDKVLPLVIQKNDDDDDKKSLVSWQMTMRMASTRYQIFLPELLTTIRDL